MTTSISIKNPENSGHELLITIEAPVTFGSTQWQKLYDHRVVPGHRIELEVASGRRFIVEEDIPHAASILAKG